METMKHQDGNSTKLGQGKDWLRVSLGEVEAGGIQEYNAEKPGMLGGKLGERSGLSYTPGTDGL